MVADWGTTLDAVQELPEVTPGPCGYWGLSMGTIFGLPVVAAETRVAVAVLGLMGIAGPTKDRFAADAAIVECPLLFLVQWHDELFPRDLAFALFEAFASTDKRMHVSPGMHAEVPAEEFEASGKLLASHLRHLRPPTYRRDQTGVVLPARAAAARAARATRVSVGP